MAPWSVTATAGIPSRRASLKIGGACGVDLGASIRAAPSSREYSECVCRWTKLRVPSVVVPSPSTFSTDVESYNGVIRAWVRTYAPPSEQSTMQVPTGELERLEEIGRERLLHRDDLAGQGMHERQTQRVKERPPQAQPRRLVPAATVAA